MTSLPTRTRLALAAALVAATAGCNDPGARTVETGSSETVTSIDHIDDQDWAKAANKLTTSMLGMDSLFAAKADGSKKRLGIGRVTNDTAEPVDVDLLVKQIRVTLNKSGKVVTTTTGGLATEDVLAQRNKAAVDFNKGDGTTPLRALDYSLSGKLIQTRARAGNTRQSTFYFQLTLTDPNGDGVWEDQAPITKIGTHDSVGL